MRKLARAIVGALAAIGYGCSSSSGGDPGLTPPPPPPPPAVTVPSIAVAPAFPALAFTSPIALLQAPGDASDWYVVEQRGTVQVFVNDVATGNADLFVDISSRVNSSFSESGLLGMAFHPDYPTTPFVYLSYTATGQGGGNPLISRISRFQTLDGGLTISAGTEQVVIEVLQDGSNHNGGNILFGPDGFLYAGFGDGGGAGDPNDNAQNPSNLLGTIIRLDVDSAQPYAIVPANPNSANAQCVQGFGSAPCPEIFAWGLRNPWKFSFDLLTGLWAGDVGQGAWEEIDLVVAGANYGWRQREGAHCFNPTSGCSTAFTDPYSEYDHSIGQSVTGGFVYRGTEIGDLVGWYVFGDFVSGRLFGFPVSAAAGVTPSILDETPFRISAFARDTASELYVVDYATGTIFTLVDDP